MIHAMSFTHVRLVCYNINMICLKVQVFEQLETVSNHRMSKNIHVQLTLFEARVLQFRAVRLFYIYLFFSSVYAVHVTLSVCDLLNVINLHGVLWHGTIPRRFRYLNMTKIDWTAMQVEIDNSNIFIRLLLFHAIELLFYTIKKKRLWTWSIVRPQDCWFPIFYLFVHFIGTCTFVHTVCTVHCTLYPNTQLLTLIVRYCQISVARWSFTISLPFCFIVDAKLLLCVANGIVTIDVLINRPMDLFLNW